MTRLKHSLAEIINKLADGCTRIEIQTDSMPAALTLIRDFVKPEFTQMTAEQKELEKLVGRESDVLMITHDPQRAKQFKRLYKPGRVVVANFPGGEKRLADKNRVFHYFAGQEQFARTKLEDEFTRAKFWYLIYDRESFEYEEDKQNPFVVLSAYESFSYNFETGKSPLFINLTRINGERPNLYTSIHNFRLIQVILNKGLVEVLYVNQASELVREKIGSYQARRFK